jgi:dolichyl-phosphate beta-glucosyltransferase
MKEFWIFLKYAVVGTIGTVVDVGTLYLFVEYVHIPLLISTTLSFILAVINNFILNKYWTFQNTNSNIRKQFIKFLIVALIGLGLTLILMYLFVYIINIPDIILYNIGIKGYVLSKLLTSIIVLLWNFLGNKYWSFKDTIRAVHHLDHYTFDVSIIIPAYNEAKRIAHTLEAIHQYCQQKPWTSEIIVVDDGSQDQTVEVVQQFATKIPHLKIIGYQPNHGKGYAVKQGVLQSEGAYILFTDADNSTPIEEFDKMYPLLDNYPVIIGSRYIKGSDIKIKQSKYRILIGRLGNFVIQSFLIDGIKDTQCGFKAFQHTAAKEIFSRMRINRFGFDMELLAIARLLKYDIKEIPVSWFNAADSRVRPIKDAFRTLKELIMIKLNLWGGRYH